MKPQAPLWSNPEGQQAVVARLQEGTRNPPAHLWRLMVLSSPSVRLVPAGCRRPSTELPCRDPAPLLAASLPILSAGHRVCEHHTWTAPAPDFAALRGADGKETVVSALSWGWLAPRHQRGKVVGSLLQWGPGSV